MITFNLITEVDPAIFDLLYAQSLAEFEASYPWQYWPDVVEPEDRRNQILAAFVFFTEDPDGFVWTIHSDDTPVMMGAGRIEDGEAIWYTGVAGVDAGGHKSWMYHPEYTSERNRMWDELGIDGWSFEVATLSSGIAQHIANKQNSADVGGSVEITNVTKRDKELIHIKVTRNP